MLDIKETKTEENLREAFTREAKAVREYDIYAEQAKNEGYNSVSEMFMKLSDNDLEHGKIWFKLLNGGMTLTEDNVKNAMNNEDSKIYMDYAKQARDDGLDEMSAIFEQVARIKKSHNDMIKSYMKEFENMVETMAEGEQKWECKACGYEVIGISNPKRCPVCGREKTFKAIFK